MAAALVLLSFWKPERPLVDPFCGSGTIPIEAAMIGRNMAPGLQRTFAAEAWPALPAALWEEARRGGPAGDSGPTCRTANHAAPTWTTRRCELARHHAQKAGVAEDDPLSAPQLSPSCTASVPTAASSAIRPTASGWAGPAKSQALYRDMPEVFRRLKTWSFYVLTAHPDFEAVRGPRGRPAAEALQRPHRVYVLPVLRPEAAGTVPIFAPRTRSVGGRKWTVPLAAAPAAAASRPSAGSRPRPGEQAEIFRSRLANGPGTSAAGPPAGHHLLPALRSRHPRGAAGGGSLRGLSAHRRVSSGRTSTRPPSTAIGST